MSFQKIIMSRKFLFNINNFLTHCLINGGHIFHPTSMSKTV